MNTISHALQVTIRAIDSLLPDPTNAREHPPRQIQQLARSIHTFGFNCPVLIDGEGQVIAGHGRLLAAQSLGWKQVPTICLEHLTPTQVQAYRIADNRLTDCSTWNDRLLAEQLCALSSVDLDFDLTAIGFELPEIDLRIQSLSIDGTERDDEPELGSGAAVTQIGDVWRLGVHRILCGDALAIESYATLLGSDQAHMGFADPPYNVPISGHVTGNGRHQHREFAMACGEMSPVEFTRFLSGALGHMTRASISGALHYVCMDWRHMGELSAAAIQNTLVLKNLCVWDKGVGGMGSFYRSQHELIFVYRCGEGETTNNVQLGRFGRNRTNVWAYPGANAFSRRRGPDNPLSLHPTVKPIGLVADAILDASRRGQTVLDPFLGSGTTLLAAERTGRAAAGMELDPVYVDTAIRRWQRMTGAQATHAQTGETFEVMERQRAVSLSSGHEQEAAR